MRRHDPETLRIASYNIHKAVGTDRKRRPDRIYDVISSLHADIVVLQEADLRLGPRQSALDIGALTQHTGLTPLGVAKNAVSLGWHGNALLFGPAIKVQEIHQLDLPGVEPRGAIIADLATPQGGLRVVGVHLGLLRGSRRKQLTTVVQHLESLPPRPTVITGDFNEWSMTVGLGRLAKHFSLHAPGRSFHARRPVAALDRIAVNEAVTLATMGVFRDALAAVASDHLPIWADLRLG